MVTALHVSQLPRFKELQLFEPSKNRPARRFFRFKTRDYSLKERISRSSYGSTLLSPPFNDLPLTAE